MNSTKTTTAITSNHRPRFETRQELYAKFEANARKLGLDDSRENIELSVLETLAKRQAKAPGRFLTTKEVARLYRAERLPSFAKIIPDQGPYQALIEVVIGKHVFRFVEDGFVEHVIAANEDRARKAREESTKQKQKSAAARELHRRYLTKQLPEGCEVVMEEDNEVRIQTPLALFIIRAATTASVHELSIEQIDKGWDADTVAA